MLEKTLQVVSDVLFFLGGGGVQFILFEFWGILLALFLGQFPRLNKGILLDHVGRIDMRYSSHGSLYSE